MVATKLARKATNTAGRIAENRALKGAVSRKANSSWTPGKIARTSFSSSVHSRSNSERSAISAIVDGCRKSVFAKGGRT